jgi:hypothetical protein
LAFAIEAVIGTGVKQILQAIFCGQGAKKSGDCGTGVERASLVVLAAGACGEVVGQVNEVRAGGNPETA